MKMKVYLSGEIHSKWREEIRAGIESGDLPIELMAPIVEHDASDRVGVEILGPEEDGFWRDHKGAKINNIRSRTLIDKADVVVVKFGDQYRQWNAAFDAGYAVAKGKPLITLHPEELSHPLKEVNACSMAVARTPQEVVQILKYVSQ